METNTTDLALTTAPPIDEKILDAKAIAWGNMGKEIYTLEMTLDFAAQQALPKIKTPTKIEEYKEAVKTIEEATAFRSQLSEHRKETTRKLEAVITRMMAPEKSFEEPLTKAKNACIALKKQDEERESKESNKLAKLAECREFILKTKNDAEAGFKKAILEKLDKVYEYALGIGNTTAEKLPAFMATAKTRMSEANFKIEYPINKFSDHISNDEFIKICNELLIINSKIYLDQYHKDIDLKFVDYDVALLNKEKALAIAKEESGAKEQAIINEKSNADAAAVLGSLSSAVDGVLSQGLKPLKSNYAIDMQENEKSAQLIMTAFVQFFHLCKPYLNVNKWFSLTISQAAVALSKVKTKDEAFAPAGITFKTVDKLK